LSASTGDGPQGAAPWRFVETWDVPPELAMGLDEALLEARDPRPVLRLYSWRPDTLSLGYFQALDEVPVAAGLTASSATRLVRRITGGGAIHHHGGELTYSLAADASHPLFHGPVPQSYARIHGVLIEAILAAGLAPTHAPGLAGFAGMLASDIGGTGMCFHASTPLDLVWDGRKGVGSAQRRTGGRVLHHGSIKLAPSPWEPAVATLAEAGVQTSPRSLAPFVLEAFVAAFGAPLEEEPPNAAELEDAARRGAPYTSEEFVRHRRGGPRGAGAGRRRAEEPPTAP
jgi:lipoate-protein ligase A